MAIHTKVTSVTMDEIKHLVSDRAVSGETMLLNMGPQHPSTHGVLRLLLELDGETIISCIPDVGFLHTGIEKSMEGLELSEAVLDLSDMIEHLYKDLGSYQKASRDRVQLLTKRDVLRGEAKGILSGLRDDLSLEEANRLHLKRGVEKFSNQVNPSLLDYSAPERHLHQSLEHNLHLGPSTPEFIKSELQESEVKRVS